MSFQLFAKTSSAVEVFHGYPTFDEISSASVANSESEGKVIQSLLSPCGRFMAKSYESKVVLLIGENWETTLVELPLKNVYDLKFSPSGNFLSSWERPLIDDTEHMNCKIWNLNTSPLSTVPKYSYKAATQSSWTLQFSQLDDYAIKSFGKELRIIKITGEDEFNFDSPFATLTPDQHFTTYQISPAEHPTICTFTKEKSGKPAQLTIWPITTGKITKQIVTKQFFKADSCHLKWNALGNAILCETTTDFDHSNKSYYGENNLYLLSFQGVNGSLGGESVRVSLGKEGPIHDFNWSPTSRQFGVIYGFMPATITFFDLKGNAIHSLNEQRKNTLEFAPNGKYILVGGFGNLQGSVDILDRHDKFRCISKFSATNTSVCKWSPGGEFILTATTSPRLRVDNGLKIWHYSGTLVFAKEYKELLKVDWRTNCPFRIIKDGYVTNGNKLKDEELKLDPKLRKHQLEIHPAVTQFNLKNPNKSSTNLGAKKPAGAYKPPHARKANVVVGTTTTRSPISTPTPPPQQSAASQTSPEEKKIRSLLKKLRAIESLKVKQTEGVKLENTQVTKIQSEPKILKELELLGWKGELDS
ncbi:unnamed protein product [Kluyveromyces dobzhanskii CBS 2104]|uniref:Eukaryotic translation initiation factor 2A n=1 Tax=Kluyveromyces dobzhanskii CBS 2104 TaxID=1427455 RepID=A0A0A8L8Q9_9SACH|nr:unnamed protein product [Kluyveromyces dobzhanskii CBS 2104]